MMSGLLATTSLFQAILHRWQLGIDVVILVVFGTIHVISWPRYDEKQEKSMEAYKQEAQEGVRAAATGGVAVAGILIPLSILTVGLTAETKYALPAGVQVDFFVACVWLLLSLLAGVGVLYYVGVRGYVKNVLTSRGLGATYGFQLLFLAVGVFRLVFGMYGLVDHLI